MEFSGELDPESLDAGSNAQEDFLQIYTLGRPATPRDDDPAGRGSSGGTGLYKSWCRGPVTQGVLPWKQELLVVPSAGQ